MHPAPLIRKVESLPALSLPTWLGPVMHLDWLNVVWLLLCRSWTWPFRGLASSASSLEGIQKASRKANDRTTMLWGSPSEPCGQSMRRKTEQPKWQKNQGPSHMAPDKSSQPTPTHLTFWELQARLRQRQRQAIPSMPCIRFWPREFWKNKIVVSLHQVLMCLVTQQKYLKQWSSTSHRNVGTFGVYSFILSLLETQQKMRQMKFHFNILLHTFQDILRRFRCDALLTFSSLSSKMLSSGRSLYKQNSDYQQ